jgi:hypothetical protein
VVSKFYRLKNNKRKKMKKLKVIMISLMILSFGSISFNISAQTAGAAISKKVGVYVFPAQNQSPAQLEKDQTDCYSWAIKESGVDPLNPPQVQAAQVSSGPDGGAVVGSAKGAAAGAAIGAIAGDAGKGAAIGAVGGALRGRRSSKMHKAQQQESNNQAAAQAEATLDNNFKKAYSACLEGKGYTVK